MTANDIRVLFCADPFDPRKPDPAYADEAAAAERLGLPIHLISFETLVDGHDAVRAIRRVPEQSEPTPAIYRGWMFRPGQYGRLYDALSCRGVLLINDPTAYALCHLLPNWYPRLEPWTPRSAWITAEAGVSTGALATALAQFDGKPVIVKDFVKSQKHAWDQACFIPSSSDLPAAERVVRRFLELQGPELVGGLVLREFESFAPLSPHPTSGMRMTREYRAYILDGKPVVVSEYWDSGEYAGESPPLEWLQERSAGIDSRFFTMDVAQHIDGRWRIVELGDGQVAGLPDRTSPDRLYGKLGGLSLGP
jgi:hypothetical protein